MRTCTASSKIPCLLALSTCKSNKKVKNKKMVKFSVTFSLLGKFKARGLGVSCKAHRDQCRSRANGIVDDDPAQKRVNGSGQRGSTFYLSEISSRF